MVAAEIMVDSLRLKGTLTSRMPRCGDRHECCRECEFALAARWGTDGVCSAVAELKCRRAISGGFHPGSGTSHDGQRGECKDKSKDCRSGCLGRRSAFHYSVLLPHFGGRDRAGSGVVRIVSRDLRRDGKGYQQAAEQHSAQKEQGGLASELGDSVHLLSEYRELGANG